MNRDIHRRGFEAGSVTGAARPAAGKQTLSERGAEPSHPELIQRTETGPAKAKDPSQAFAAAASGSFSEIPYRAEMESRFGADFSSVQSFAGRGLADLGALAATRGEQVVFQSASPDRQTVAHELTHVLQSRQGLASSGKVMSDPGDASEHEARGVAASLDGPETGQFAPLVAAAPSGEIHRQERTWDPITDNPPHAAVRGGEQQGAAINWDRKGGISIDAEVPFISEVDGSIRDAYHWYLLTYLPVELPAVMDEYEGEKLVAPAVTPETARANVTERAAGRAAQTAMVEATLSYLTELMAVHRAAGTEAELLRAEEIRTGLFRASQQALVSTLNVEQSKRYQKAADGSTFCNVFAYDMVTAMGAYLPRNWWGDLENGGTGIQQLSANALYQWMLDWGPKFGWREVCDPERAQEEANAGKVVVILGGTGVVKAGIAPGHITVVMAESAVAGSQRASNLPLQSQAGDVNFSSNAAGIDDGLGGIGDTAWWNSYPTRKGQDDRPLPTESLNQSWTEYAAGAGFFVYEGRAYDDVSIRAAEEMGLVAPGQTEVPAGASTQDTCSPTAAG